MFLLDISWHVYRNFYTFTGMSSYEKEYLGHYYGVARTLMQIHQNYPGSKIVLCKDGYPRKKYELFPDYKAGRSKEGYCVGKDIQDIIDISLLMENVFVAHNEEEESDDIMYTLSKLCKRAYIFSGDDDLLQSITDQVKVVRHFDRGRLKEIGKREVMTEENFVKKYCGCSPENLPIFRSIVGDKSDNLNGLARFPRDLALYVAQSVKL